MQIFPFIILTYTQDEFIVMGSDDLFNMVTPQMSVKIVQESCKGDIKNAVEAYIYKAAQELSTICSTGMDS